MRHCMMPPPAPATGACLLEVETCLIQGLAEAAIKASTPTMAGHLRRVLQVRVGAAAMWHHLDLDMLQRWCARPE